MACGKHLSISRFSIFMAIFMVVLIMPSVHSSRSRLQGGITEPPAAAENTERAAQDFQIRSLGKGTSGVATEDSVREVPSGSDPLHHNRNPKTP